MIKSLKLQTVLPMDCAPEGVTYVLWYTIIKEYYTMLKHNFSYLDTTGSLQKSKKEIIALLEE